MCRYTRDIDKERIDKVEIQPFTAKNFPSFPERYFLSMFTERSPKMFKIFKIRGDY